jgi:hypothetical protein
MASRIDLLWVLFGLDFNDFNTLVVATRRANLVRQTHCVALGAGNHVPGHKRQMAAPATLAAFAHFVLW